jgi:DnaJ-class molecular chaperone
MNKKREKRSSECQSCSGTGFLAGAQPMRTGPYVLEPPPCQVCRGTGRSPQPKE